LRVRPEYEPDIRAVSARVVTGQFKAELESPGGGRPVFFVIGRVEI
jgi:hypothetical protein